VSARLCAQHPPALRKDVLASSRHLEPLPATPPHPLACSPRNAASCSGVTARACAWQHRHLLRVPRARVRAGDRCAAGRAPSPPARVLTRTPRAQSSSPQPVARRASCLSGSSSSERRPTPRCTRAARARATPLPPGRFVRLAGGEKRICEYNQEACRLTAFDGRKSLIRSFPSKVGVRAAAPRTGVGGGLRAVERRRAARRRVGRGG